MKIVFGECQTCTAYKSQIADLKELLAQERKEKLDERSEYKRAIDALLVKTNAPAIGQGVAEQKGPMDLSSIFGMFEEKDQTKEN